MRLCRILLAIAVTTCALAQSSVDAKKATGYKDIGAARPELRANLEFLTSKPLAGRLSLERGSDVAAAFIAAEFEKAGLKPAANGSFLQPIPLIEYHPDLAQMALTLTTASGKTDYKYLKDFTGAFPEDRTIAAPLVFAGYGITAPEFNNYDDYAGLDVRGKIVVIFDHEPQENDPKSEFNGTGNTRYSSSRLKALNAQQRGALAVLLANEPNRKHPSNFERLKRIAGIEERYKQMPLQALADSPLQIPIFSINDDVVNAIFAPSGKKPGDVQSELDRTLKPVRVDLANASVEMRAVNTDRKLGITNNVAGLLDGSDPKLRAETVIISAHSDHDGARGVKMYPGADDNGSGTVGVIELARAFEKNPAKPKRSILFIVFAAEERGLLGSYGYVEHPLRPLNTTRAVINFDMIGRNETPSAQTEGLIQIPPDTSNELNLIGTNNTADYRRTIEQSNQAVGLKLDYKFDQDAALNVIQRSDQFPFTLHNIPAVWWFTGFHPDYHQPTDTVEKINFDKMVKILRLAYLSAWQFADGAISPQYFVRSADCACALPE